MRARLTSQQQKRFAKCNKIFIYEQYLDDDVDRKESV